MATFAFKNYLIYYMKIFNTIIFLFFTIQFASAQLSTLEKMYGVTVEARNNSFNELFRAEKLMDKKKYDECFPILIKVANTNPVILNTYESIFYVSIQLKNYSNEVIDILTKGKEIYNNHDEISFFIAELLTLKKEYKKALIEYNNAIEIQKNNKNKSIHSPFYYSSRGFCHIQLMSFSQAEKDYTNFLEINPKNPIGLLNRGFCYYKLGEIEKAKKDWKVASENGSDEAKEFLQKLSGK